MGSWTEQAWLGRCTDTVLAAIGRVHRQRIWVGLEAGTEHGIFGRASTEEFIPADTMILIQYQTCDQRSCVIINLRFSAKFVKIYYRNNEHCYLLFQ